MSKSSTKKKCCKSKPRCRKCPLRAYLAGAPAAPLDRDYTGRD